MESGTTDISTHPGYSWAMDLDLMLSSSSGLDNTMVLGDSAGHSGMTLAVMWPSGTNMTTGFDLDPRHLCGL